MPDEPCVFCEIAAGRTPAHRVYDDGQVFAILTLEQPTPFKVIVIPRRHVSSIYELTDDLAAAVMQATVKVARAVRDASGCPGLNLVQANRPVGQQDVFHFHLHIVPRFPDDGIILNWDNTRAPEADLALFAAALCAHLQRSPDSKTSTS